MAEILIKNMKMQKDMRNPLHISIFSNGSVWITHEGKTEATAQELLPHGRLGDLDALEESLEASDEDIYTKHILWDAPTIIEDSK